MNLSPRSKRLAIAGSAIVCAVGVLTWGALPRGPLRIVPPPSDGEPGRWVCLAGAANTRDAGGYATRDGQFVRRGLVYRSGTLSHLSSDGVAAYRRLGVKTVLDLRNRLSPLPLFNGDVLSVQLASRVQGCPMSFKKDGPRREFYIRGVRDNAVALRAAFESLSVADNYPVLYHCAAGTDRTGVMSALLLALLGVDDATIIADFRLSEQIGSPGDAEALAALLGDIAERGGIESYLAQIGVTPPTQARIRALLLESNGPLPKP